MIATRSWSFAPVVIGTAFLLHTAKAGRHLARHVLDLVYFEADDMLKELRR